MSKKINWITIVWNKQTLIIFIFAVALILRFLLCFYNRQANDNHVEVISWILDKHTIPVKEDCWECSQPKIYYLLNAALMNAFHINDPIQRIITAQMFNFVLSVFLLVFVWLFIRNQNFSFRTKILAFSVVAFNPCLTGINVQATNDTMEILAGTMTLYFTDLFFRKWRVVHFIGMTLCVILACVTKGSGLSLLLGLMIVYAANFIIQPKQKLKFLVISSAAFLVALMITVPFGGGYYANYKKYNNPFMNNISHKDPPPEFFHETFVARPGITSIVHGYFTFRIVDMIQQPYINNETDGFPLHRTSLWSQLYGRTFFSYFDQFPGTWASTERKIILLGRILLILGLVPLGIFILGCYHSCRDICRFIFRKNKTGMIENLSWMHFVFIVSCLLFIVKYTYDYRDYSTMKSIFVFPVLLSPIYLFMQGIEKIKARILQYTLSVLVICLVLFSIMDILFLLNQLKDWSGQFELNKY